jgi:hypothetical protein
VSAETWREVQMRVVSRRISSVTLRGRSMPLDLFALEMLRFEDEESHAEELTERSVVRW